MRPALSVVVSEILDMVAARMQVLERKRPTEAVLAAKFQGMSASISLLDQPLAMRSSVCVSQPSGSTLFIFAVCRSVAMVAQVLPPPSLPAKSEFFLVIAISQNSAHVGRDVVVWYRWHPYFERTVRCEYTEERANGRVAHIVVRPGEVIVVLWFPHGCWIATFAKRSALALWQPRVTVDALTDLHNLLIDRGFRHGPESGSNAQEVIDEDTAPAKPA